jgi:hypothetical protein
MSESQSETEKIAIDEAVLSLVVEHLLSRYAKTFDDPQAWIRDFADEVHMSMDRAKNPPPDHQSKMETARNRLDTIMNAVRLRLK